MTKLNRRQFLKLTGVVLAGVAMPAIALDWDSMLLEDNRTYKGILGSGPQHYVGQEVTDVRTGVVYVCTTICDDMSLWQDR